MGKRGEWNVGQLVRERYGRDAVNVGFTTYDGTVTAASDWDAPAEQKRVRQALPGSYEALFHEVGLSRFLLDLRDGEVGERLRGPRLERAIGVIYRPETERQSHYFHASLTGQFDAVIHLDRTTAVQPLDRDSGQEQEGEVPETFPPACEEVPCSSLCTSRDDHREAMRDARFGKEHARVDAVPGH